MLTSIKFTKKANKTRQMQWQYIVTKRTEGRGLTLPVTADFKLEESLQPMYVHSLHGDLGMSFTRGDSPKDVINSVYD